MDEQTSAVNALPHPSSFFTRMSNIFAAPGEVFSELAVQPVQTSSWMIPLLLMVLIMAGSTLFMFSNELLRNQALEKQREAVQKMVDEGKLTQDQADAQSRILEGKIVTISATGAAVVFGVIIFFAIPLVVWICAKIFLKFGGGYLKIVEMYGLSSIVGILGGVVTILMMNIFGSIHASPGAWLAIMQSYDPRNFVHTVISAINVFTIWQVAILGIGLAKVSQKETGTGMGVAFGLYVVVVLVMAGFAQLFK
jgi:hypothetical protein